MNKPFIAPYFSGINALGMTKGALNFFKDQVYGLQAGFLVHFSSSGPFSQVNLGFDIFARSYDPVNLFNDSNHWQKYAGIRIGTSLSIPGISFTATTSFVVPSSGFKATLEWDIGKWLKETRNKK